MHRYIRITAQRSIYKTTALSCELIRHLATLPWRYVLLLLEPSDLRGSRPVTAEAIGHGGPRNESFTWGHQLRNTRTSIVTKKSKGSNIIGARTYNNWELITHFINLIGAYMPSVLYN